MQANGLPADKLTHSSWTEEFGGNGDIHIEFHISGLSTDEAGRLSNLLTKGRQA
ncbi:hypothetical protein [Streptomyces sp. NPDC059874]|uniref:hypothetical protein n=1 Tax=Streptomyces sp. NPDC059874 TaxID=3346983 RepID=UPI0036657344